MSRYVMRVKEELQSSSSFTLITTGRIETYQIATYSIITLLKMSYWSPKHVELLNVMNKINHQILCILLDYRYTAKWYTVNTISNKIINIRKNIINNPIKQSFETVQNFLYWPTAINDFCSLNIFYYIRCKCLNCIRRLFINKTLYVETFLCPAYANPQL